MDDVIIAESAKEHYKLLAKVDTIRIQLSIQLEHFESDFESDEGRFSYERMSDYLDAATFMRNNFKREDPHNYIGRVQQIMKGLPV